jgi:hypothetical protein
MRIYNSNYGKFLSVDPLGKKFAWNSTYAFAENRPIQGIDLDGGEFLDKTTCLIQFSAGYGAVVLKTANFTSDQKSVWKNINENTANWGKHPNATIGASPVIADISEKKIKVPDKAPNDNDANDVSSSFNNAQTNVLPYATENKASGAGSNGGSKYKNGSMSPYQNTGPGTAASASNSANFIMAAISLYDWYDKTTQSIAWSNVVQGSWQQSKFAKRTVELVNDAVRRGLIDQKNQNNSDMYAIMNYVLQGDAFGNKEAEKVAKKIIEVYSVPIQVQAPANPVPLPATTYGSTPNSNSDQVKKLDTKDKDAK